MGIAATLPEFCDWTLRKYMASQAQDIGSSGKESPLKVYVNAYSPDAICRLCGFNFMQLQVSIYNTVSAFHGLIFIIRFVIETTCSYISFL